jgi:plastocyanin
MRWKAITAVVAVASLLAVGCSGGETRRAGEERPGGEGRVAAAPDGPPAGCLEAGGGALEVVAIDNEFEPTCISVSGDQEILVKHEGTYTHSFTIGAEEAFRTPFLLDIDPIESGERVRTGPISDSVEPGTYPFFCKFHAGMQGELWLAA